MGIATTAYSYNYISNGVIINFINKLRKNSGVLGVLGDGTQKKSYIDVKDCVEDMLFVYEKSEDNIWNISSNDRITVSEIAKIVVDRVAKGAKIKYTGTPEGWPGDITDMFLSNKKLKYLGFVPRKKSREAVENALEMYIKNNLSINAFEA